MEERRCGIEIEDEGFRWLARDLPSEGV